MVLESETLALEAVDSPIHPDWLNHALLDNQAFPDNDVVEVNSLVDLRDPTTAELTSESQLMESENDLEVSDLVNVAELDSVSLYLKELYRYPIPPAEEQTKLAEVMIRGRELRNSVYYQSEKQVSKLIKSFHQDIEAGYHARAALIVGNLRSVVALAKHCQNRGLPFSDLIQAGNFGLIWATFKFEHGHENVFPSYAHWWIRQSIEYAITHEVRTIQVPSGAEAEVNHLYRITQDFLKREGREPSLDELSATMAMPPNKVKMLLRVSQPTQSLQEPIGEAGDLTLEDTLEDTDSESPEERSQRALVKNQIKKIIGDLPPRHRQIIELRFGLVDNAEYTLAEIGQKFGITRERVRQIESAALRRLQRLTAYATLSDFL